MKAMLLSLFVNMSEVLLWYVNINVTYM